MFKFRTVLCMISSVFVHKKYPLWYGDGTVLLFLEKLVFLMFMFRTFLSMISTVFVQKKYPVSG